MTRAVRDDLSGDYAECADCGHAVEDHDVGGCGFCFCPQEWTPAEIRRVRLREGLAPQRRLVSS